MEIARFERAREAGTRVCHDTHRDTDHLRELLEVRIDIDEFAGGTIRGRGDGSAQQRTVVSRRLHAGHGRAVKGEQGGPIRVPTFVDWGARRIVSEVVIDRRDICEEAAAEVDSREIKITHR